VEKGGGWVAGLPKRQAGFFVSEKLKRYKMLIHSILEFNGNLIPQIATGQSATIRGQARRGQVVLEYFLVFAVVALLTLIGLTSFDDDIRNALGEFFNAAANKIAN